MSGMNMASLDKRLRFQLECSTIRWVDPKSDQFATIEPDMGNKDIELPPGQDDYYTLSTLYHELIHVAMPGELAAFGVMEEKVIDRVAVPTFMQYVMERPQVHQFWLRKLRDAGWVEALQQAREV